MVSAAADPDKRVAGARRSYAGAAGAFLFTIWFFLFAGDGSCSGRRLAFAAGDRVVDRVIWNGGGSFVERVDGQVPRPGL